MADEGLTTVPLLGLAKRAPKEKPGPLEYLRRWPLRLIVGATLVFLYLPLITLMVFSFNTSRRNVVWQGFTTDWYVKAFNNESLLQAFVNSLTIAFLCTVISVILGALSAVMLWRFRFPGKTIVEGSMALPIVVPEICMGVAMLVFFARVMPWPMGMPWPLNLGAITIAHVSFAFPFVATVVRARLSFNRGRRPRILRERVADVLGRAGAAYAAGPDRRRVAGVHLVAR
jgi:spermidine/putrescine transport system permease protein